MYSRTVSPSPQRKLPHAAPGKTPPLKGHLRLRLWFRNIIPYVPNYMTSYPRRLKSSLVWLTEVLSGHILNKTVHFLIPL